MSTILVSGSTTLSGNVSISGSKNAALPILAACLLNDKPVNLLNVPRLEDVEVMCEVLGGLGADIVPVQGDHERRIDASGVSSTEPSYELVNKMRASFLVLGPLLARFGEASVPLPGGCNLGPRPVGEHIAALEALGAEVVQESGRIVARAKRLKGTNLIMNIISVGATENALMAASLAQGTTTIHNAASEPEVVDLCSFLEHCGVPIEGAGTNTITIHGQDRISQELSYKVIPDRLEAGTYLLALLATGGEGVVHDIIPAHLEALVLRLRECGLDLEVGEDSITVHKNGEIKPVDLQTAPYPGFPTDLQPQMSVLLTAANGVSTLTENIFEKRMSHVPEMVRMGAKIQVKGNSAIIEGNRGGLSGVQVEAYDLRCAAALVIAGLMAEGETQITGVGHIMRGYEDLPGKMASLGGQVTYLDADGRGKQASAG